MDFSIESVCKDNTKGYSSLNLWCFSVNILFCKFKGKNTYACDRSVITQKLVGFEELQNENCLKKFMWRKLQYYNFLIANTPFL